MVRLVRHRQTKGSATDRLRLNHRATPRLHKSGLWYRMTAIDPWERLKGISANGLEWSETNGLVSATQLRRAPPLGHLFAKPIRSCKPGFYELMV
jgi:hypothetical protein